MEFKLQLPSKSAINSPSDTRNRIEHAIVNFGVVMRINAEAIIKNSLTKRMDTLHSKIVKAVESSFEDTS